MSKGSARRDDFGAFYGSSYWETQEERKRVNDALEWNEITEEVISRMQSRPMTVEEQEASNRAIEGILWPEDSRADEKEASKKELDAILASKWQKFTPDYPTCQECGADLMKCDKCETISKLNTDAIGKRHRVCLEGGGTQAGTWRTIAN